MQCGILPLSSSLILKLKIKNMLHLLHLLSFYIITKLVQLLSWAIKWELLCPKFVLSLFSTVKTGWSKHILLTN